MSRNNAPGEGAGELRRSPRPMEGPRQGILRSRTGVPSQDAEQAQQPARSGGLFKSPFPLQTGAPTRRQVPDSEFPGVGDDPAGAARLNRGFASRREREEALVPAGGGASRRSTSYAPDEQGERDFEHLEDAPRSPRRVRGEEDGYPAPRRRSRPKEADFNLPGEPPVPASGAARRPRSIILKALLAIFLLATCSAGPIAVLKLYRAYTFARSITGQELPTVNTGGNPGPQATPLPNDLTSLDHFNMLLLGSDDDAKFASGAVLTQTDIVVRVDLKQHKVTMVSIPRDFWIENDYGHCCYKLDEISGNETDGARTPLDAKKHGFAHTKATIERDFQIPISAYAWVGLNGFVKVIDTLGGVDVDVLHPIVDDAYPNDVDSADPHSYKRLYIPAGPQHLDGKTALEYVRSRHSDLTGDFGRSARQQSVLVALKKKLDDPAVFTKLDEFADDLQDSVLTSLSISQVLQLANFAKSLKSSDIKQVVLSAPTYGRNDQVNGKSVVQPIWPAINQTIRQIFTDSTGSQVNLSKPSPTDAQTIRAEGARIVIENGTNVAGAANKLKTILAAEGFNVVSAQSADRSDYSLTHVQYFDPKKGSGTAQILGKMLGVLAELSGVAGPPEADIVIIIGSDTVNAIMQA